MRFSVQRMHIFARIAERRQKMPSVDVKRKGVVEGTPIEKTILLDISCSKTLVRQELIPVEKILEGEAVTIRYAYGDTVLYPVAKVRVKVDGMDMEVSAAVSETLPVDVLLGKDVPEFL